ncbi:DUF4124 domain-containing protein [Massilia sp. W12]|uniref:DUF4124 domain-containing protein n=1 Tax=Massilia sp. W12 TaxID=3126507 RepID=UPI0030CE9B01
MNKRAILCACVAASLSLSLSAPAHAQQIYQCKDASGRTLTSDRPIPECADRSTKLLGKDGTVRKEIGPPPTAEQKAAMKAEEEKKKAEQAALAEQKKRDMLLLSMYRSEKEIEAARERKITQIRNEIIEANNAADAYAQKRKSVQKEIDKIKSVNPKAKISQEMQTRFDDANTSEQGERKRAEKLEADLIGHKQYFDEAMSRFKELNGQTNEKPKR